MGRGDLQEHRLWILDQFPVFKMGFTRGAGRTGQQIDDPVAQDPPPFRVRLFQQGLPEHLRHKFRIPGRLFLSFQFSKQRLQFRIPGQKLCQVLVQQFVINTGTGPGRHGISFPANCK
jgi:hypothetical protein